MNTITKIYEGHNITFDKEKNVMVNATEMAKPFGKLVKDWTVNKSTQEFLSSLSAVRGIPLSEMIKVVKGGDPKLQGTWMHEDVALEFARWLSPKFAIWCNDRIKELLTTGSVTFNIPQTFADALQLAADQQREIERQQKQLEEQAPKVEYADSISISKSNCKVNELAKFITQAADKKGLGIKMGERKLYEWLRKNDYLAKTGKSRNLPNQRYIENGIFVMKKSAFMKGDTPATSYTTYVTEKGQKYFIEGFLSGKFNL